MSDNVMLSVYRYDPSVDESPRFEEYEIPWQDDGETDLMSVHQCLCWLSENGASDIVWDHNCGNGLCGRCGVMVNGVPKLACWAKVEKGGSYTVEPLAGMPVIRDLVVDKRSNYDKFVGVDAAVQAVKPITELIDIDYDLFFNTLHRLESCKECMCCYASCTALNTTATDSFIGPGAMMELALRHADPKDEADRVWQAVFHGGLFECVQCGMCTTVCPNAIDIRGFIKELMDEAAERGIAGANPIMPESTVAAAKEIASM